ncbi:hypothetical protein [uncultured Photobacterium sp.]|uniref:hypothetical protein n=1 Tax=uncultured Photobacterium sp. TaxID=173973 RepID=UPI00260C84A0|nr:hypothetical protein [uncultured Photobacterium sp.]
MQSENNRIYPHDLAPLGFCCSGARGVFANYGLSWAEFVRHGADCDQLLALGDPLVTEVVLKFKQDRESSWEGRKSKR